MIYFHKYKRPEFILDISGEGVKLVRLRKVLREGSWTCGHTASIYLRSAFSRVAEGGGGFVLADRLRFQRGEHGMIKKVRLKTKFCGWCAFANRRPRMRTLLLFSPSPPKPALPPPPSTVVYPSICAPCVPRRGREANKRHRRAGAVHRHDHRRRGVGEAPRLQREPHAQRGGFCGVHQHRYVYTQMRKARVNCCILAFP